MKALILAGTQSGVGKTTVTTAILGLLKKRGLAIAPFKTGPDYIDPKFHLLITGEKSYNLDTWMLDRATVKEVFLYHSQEKDIALIEGVMGLFDGLGPTDRGSTAELARTLNIPVVLVVNARGIGASIVPMIKGYVEYDTGVQVAGVIFNNVSGENHYNLLKEAVESKLPVACAGYMPRDESLHLESKHLGLVPVEELETISEDIKKFTEIAEDSINMDCLLDIAGSVSHDGINPRPYGRVCEKAIRVAVAMDEAFHFYYEDNLQQLEQMGCELIPFSPLHDREVPAVDALYIGGGYPESYAMELSENTSMKRSIRNAVENGIPVYGECGGFMYLTSEIILKDGTSCKMADIFKCSARMTERLQRFGYVEIEYGDFSMRGHEFHHGKLENLKGDEIFHYRVTKASTGKQWSCGLKKNNALGAFAHIHFLENRDFVRSIFFIP